jgi:sugar lactone lactonase YvrE
MNRRLLVLTLILTLVITLTGNIVFAADNSSDGPSLTLLASGLEGATGSTVGPDGALYLTEGATGKVSRVNPQTGNITTFATGLPQQIIPLGGAIDIAFLDGTAYVLVTLVGADLGGNDVVGIYRMDDADSFTVIADIGEFSMNNPPDTDFFVPTGLQYAIEAYRGGFLVSDGHHNRVLRVTLDGEVTEMLAFDNIVPTGLEARGNTIYMAEAGPNPHLPQNGKVVAFGPKLLSVTEVASGAPLLVDVEYGPGNTLYALSQGDFEAGNPDGSPAMPNTGSLVRVNADGTFTVILDGLNLPTSLEFIGNTAYVVSLTGEVYKIDNI